MSQHTPGPWVAEIFPFRDRAGHGAFRWVGNFNGPWGPDDLVGCVWQVDGHGQTGLPGSIEVGAANARLIAASPRMFAVLAEIVRLGLLPADSEIRRDAVAALEEGGGM
jgi:hypothetical protein